MEIFQEYPKYIPLDENGKYVIVNNEEEAAQYTEYSPESKTKISKLAKEIYDEPNEDVSEGFDKEIAKPARGHKRQ